MPERLKLKLPVGAFRITENDIDMDADGGRIVLTADAPALGELVEAPNFITQVTVVINYRKDEPMKAYPNRREDRAKRRFSVEIDEATEKQSEEARLAALDRSR